MLKNTMDAMGQRLAYLEVREKELFEELKSDLMRLRLAGAQRMYTEPTVKSRKDSLESEKVSEKSRQPAREAKTIKLLQQKPFESLSFSKPAHRGEARPRQKFFRVSQVDEVISNLIDSVSKD